MEPPSYQEACRTGADAYAPPLDLSHHLSEVTKRRQMSMMKSTYKYFQIPGIGNLAGGLPNLRFFPFDTLEAQAAKPARWTPTPNDPSPASALSSLSLTPSPLDPDPQATAHIAVPKSSPEPDPFKKIDLATALQYGLAQGYPPLLSFVRQFTREHLHPTVPYKEGPDVTLTCGSTDGFAKTLEVFVDPWIDGLSDPRARPGLLCETFVYGAVMSQAQPKGVQVVPVVADEGGMVVSGEGGLEDVLENWDFARGKRPSLMYTVTMGHNPTGIVLSLERRKEIYAVCSKYDVLIVEDDPYWFLQFPSADVEEAKSRNRAPPRAPFAPAPKKSSGYPFLDSMMPSFLSIDTDGRVIRLDTFSKMVAPGCRLGWLTAQPALIERYVRVAETSTQQPSGFVQSMIAELIMGPQTSPDAQASAKLAFASLRTPREKANFTGWHMDGWVRWLEGLRGMYERRMNRMCRILDEGSYQVKTGTSTRAADAEWGIVTKTRLIEFAWPRGGMFVWLRVRLESHPLWHAARTGPSSPSSSSSLAEVEGEDAGGVTTRGRGVLDGPTLSTALWLFVMTKPYLVLVAPGSTFSATPRIKQEIGWAYFRLCFAAVSEEDVDSCSQRFVDGVQRFWRIKKVEEIEDLLKDLDDAAIEDAAARAMGEDAEGLGNLGGWLGC